MNSYLLVDENKRRAGVMQGAIYDNDGVCTNVLRSKEKYWIEDGNPVWNWEHHDYILIHKNSKAFPQKPCNKDSK